MIDFNIAYKDSLVGGLKFQILNKKNDGKKADVCSLTDDDYKKSIVISEDAFVLVQNIFVSSISNINNSDYYHWSEHYHDKESLGYIINSLEDEILNLKNEEISDSKNEQIIRIINNSDDTNIKLHNGYHIIDNKLFINNYILFLEELLLFLKKNMSNQKYDGIYVIGI